MTPGISSRLSSALTAVSNSRSPYVFESCSLPTPGLSVHGLTEPLAFPLVPAQAEELAKLAAVCPHGRGLRTVVDADVRDCLQIMPGMLTFGNMEWHHVLDEVFEDACFSLGVPKNAVKYELYKLLLYRKGGHFKMHKDTEKTNGMFATLTVQLPSRFKGGEVVFRHRGREVEFCGGADDGTNCYNSFYSAFYADVQHEIRPIEEGYRITLVYNMSWIGSGAAPSANAVDLAEVTTALKEHAEENSAGDWHLAFMLEHEYTSQSMSEYGTAALKGADRRNAGALSVAAETLGIGELDFVLCRLKRVDDSRGEEEVLPFQCKGIDAGYVQVAEAYWDTGREFTGDLEWVDWGFACFKKVLETEPMLTGNEGMQITTTYHAMAILVWANNMDVEALFKGRGYDVASFLYDDGPEELGHDRADRMLGCIERWNYGHFLHGPQWNWTEVVLEFCLKQGLHEQASRAIRIASTLHICLGIEMILFRYVSRYGWDVIGDAVVLYICRASERGRCHTAEAVWILFQLFAWMPSGTALVSLTSVVQLVEHHYPDPLQHCSEYDGCFLQSFHWKLWVSLMSVVGDLERDSFDSERRSAVDNLVARLADVINTLTADEIGPVYRSLSQGLILNSSKHLDAFHAVSKRRFLLLRRQTFEKKANFTIEHKVAPYYDKMACRRMSDTEYDACYDCRSDIRREEDWYLMMSLCGLVASGEDIPASTAVVFRELTETIELLAEREINALSNAMCRLSGSLEEEHVFSLVEEKIRLVRSNGARSCLSSNTSL